MSLETLPIFAYNAVIAIFHGLLFVAGLALIKQAKSWWVVAAIVLGMVLFSIAATAATFFLQGSERAWSMLSPSGEMFAIVFVPVLINVFVSTSIIMFTAYGLFVAPGNQKHD